MNRAFCLLLLVSAAVLAADPKAIVEKQFVAIKTAAVAKDIKSLEQLLKHQGLEKDVVHDELLEIVSKATFTVVTAEFVGESIKANIKVGFNEKTVEKPVLMEKFPASSTGYIIKEDDKQ